MAMMLFSRLHLLNFVLIVNFACSSYAAAVDEHLSVVVTPTELPPISISTKLESIQIDPRPLESSTTIPTSTTFKTTTPDSGRLYRFDELTKRYVPVAGADQRVRPVQTAFSVDKQTQTNSFGTRDSGAEEPAKHTSDGFVYTQLSKSPQKESYTQTLNYNKYYPPPETTTMSYDYYYGNYYRPQQQYSNNYYPYGSGYGYGGSGYGYGGSGYGYGGSGYGYGGSGNPGIFRGGSGGAFDFCLICVGAG